MISWIVFLSVAAVCFVVTVALSIVYGKKRYRSGRILDSSKLLTVGVAASSMLLFIPIYINEFKTTGCGLIEGLLIAFHNVIRLFVVDGEFSFVTANLAELPDWLSRCYTLFMSLLFILAPLLTFGFVLSFFKNISAYKSYIVRYNSDAYIFSELNEKSLALAESLYEKDNGRLLVFSDVFEKNEEESFELIEKAREIGALFFKKDITTVRFSLHSKESSINFFVVGEEQTENIVQSLKLIEKFKNRENTNLYVFSSRIEAELLLDHAFENDKEEPMKIKVRRVNEVQALINRILYEDGYEKIFQSAYCDSDGIKKINAVVVGAGNHGTEMVKDLSWFCQMDGYQVEINAFDIEKGASDKLALLCPDLMNPEYNGNFAIEGDAHYKITVHSGIDANTKKFIDIISALPRTTYVFIALGNDERNIDIAIRLRSLFERLGYSPVIQSVVYNTDKKEALTGISNFKGQKYNIDFIGDVKTSYSEQAILYPDVEIQALERHKKWGEERDFWRYDYNYKSSVASAIHRKMKILCGIPGIEKAPADRTEEEKHLIRVVEHNRWNAYMRSEGYVYGGTTERKGRNDLAKMHNCLVPFDELSIEEQEKDDD